MSHSTPVVAHPYRSTPPAPLDPAVGSWSVEEWVVWAMLVAVGLLGIGIGLVAPERTTEPSLGVCVLAFMIRVTRSELRWRAQARASS